MVSYHIALDADDDGTFETPLSADVLALHWRIGMKAPFDPMPADSSAKIKLDNISGDYSPERTPLQPGQRVQIQADDGSNTHTLFTGFIQRVEPEAGDIGPRRATLYLEGAERWLRENHLRFPAAQHVRADAIIHTALDASIIRRAVINGVCVIDMPGNNVIGQTVITTENVERDFDTGKSTFVYVAERDDISAWGIIRAVVGAERGAFYFDRTGEAIFRNRHAPWMQAPQSMTLTDSMQGMIYRCGDTHTNRVEVRLTPRRIGAPHSVLWELATPQRIRAGARRRFAVRYTDAESEPASALTVDQRVTYSAALQEDGTTDMRDFLTVELQEQGANAAAIEARNTSAFDIWLTACTVRGTPLSGGDTLTVIAADTLNAHLYGLRTLRLNLSALNNVEEGAGIAEYEISRRAQPRGTVENVSFQLTDHPGALALTLFDQVTITTTQTGHNATYTLIGEEHTVTHGGAIHAITWHLQPVDTTQFVLIDRSTIGSSARLLPI